MKFTQTLIPATLIRRYKRFLADVRLADGNEITVHCPNSGSMLGCANPGIAVMLSVSDNPKRKYPHTLEMVQVNDTWIGINTSLTNKLIREAIEKEIITQIGAVDSIKAEIKVSEKSRLDFLLIKNNEQIYVEVKNCTLADGPIAMFPDAVTSRGNKHLRELLSLKEAGHRAILIFCVQRMDVDSFRPAKHIDPTYAQTLAEVDALGVEVVVCQAEVTPTEIVVIKRQLPFAR